MKKLWKLAAMTAAAMTIMACGSAETTEVTNITELTNVTEVAKDSIREAAEMTIYHSNERADGLEKQIVYTDQISAAEIISHLAQKNIVSMDTKLSSFTCKEEDGNRVAYLDLSKAFREYLNTMEESGEQVIMAALTNSFLDNFDAHAFVITIEGEVLETGHSVYEEPMGYIELEGVQKDV